MHRALWAIAGLSSIALAGCLSASDVSTAAQEPDPIPASSPVQIAGIDQFHKVARVISNACGNNKYETDRRQSAQAEILSALAGQAAALPGGLRFEVQSLDVRVRCFESQCVSDAELAAVTTGKDKRGNEIRIQQTSLVSDSEEFTILCKSAMPAVTRSVDRVLASALGDTKRRLSPLSGVP